MSMRYRRLSSADLFKAINDGQRNLDALDQALRGGMGSGERRTAKKQRSEVLDSLKAMRAEMARRKSSDGGPRVTDHALIRFLDRALLYDIDHLREVILTPQVKAAISQGMTRIPVPAGEMVARPVVLTVIDGAVTTVLEAGE